MLRYAPIALLLFALGCGTNADPEFPTAVSPCGNGEIDRREQCDDGNTLGGDGCSPVCLTEAGWACDSEPSLCAEVPVIESTCGDGRVQGTEECDDFNLQPGDGCDLGCRIEDGFVCAGEPSVCGPEAPEGCGDGVVDPTENCDDGNATPGDGCSSDCTVEDGYICQDEPSTCTEVTEAGCGNGLIEEGEECDDANVAGADGCSEECAIEPGFRCFGEPSICEPVPAVCGDGIISDGELCDDGNRITGDGCSRQCEVEDGWVCRGQPSDCLRADELCLGVDCSELNGVCVFGACDPGTGECVVQPSTDGSDCDDGDVCTDGDSCMAGECTGGLPLDCSALDSGCSVGVCDASSGECVVEALSEGDSCDDDPNDCATGICTGGECVVETLDDCASCGEAGDQFCAAGVCGGLGGENSTGFEESSVLPEGFASADWAVTTDSAHTGSNSIRSGAIGASGTTTITQTVELFEAGEVAFWYRVSSESCCDKLRFRIDGVEQSDWGGIIDWTNVTYALDAGTHTLEWAYTKDSSLNSGDDAAWVDDIVVTGGQTCEGNACAIASVFNGEECIVCDAVEDGGICESDDLNPCRAYTCEGGDCVGTPVADDTSCDLDPTDCMDAVCLAGTCTAAIFDDCTECGDGEFCAGGICGGLGGENSYDFEDGRDGFVDAGTGWTLATDRVHEGSSSLRSGTIGASGTTGVTLELDLAEDAELSFFYSVSSESCCDGLRFFVDGAELQNWRGEIAFTQHIEPIAAGIHTLEWRYTKDGSLSTGSDAAWIDTIVVGGITYCEDAGCGAAIYDGVSCVTCEPATAGTACDVSEPDPCLSYSCDESGVCAGTAVADGITCDDDPGDCRTQVCTAGVCGAANFPDCTACGDGDFCAGGECGGFGGDDTFGFEDGLGEFTSSGAAWVADTERVRTGSTAARSGSIGSGGTSGLVLEVDLESDGSVSFWYSVSSESCCDGLRFFVDGAELQFWLGEVAYTEHVEALTAGPHTLEWRYTKDLSLTGGSDAAWVDDIRLDGVNACDASICGEGLFDGGECVLCPVAPDGTDCDLAPGDCTVDSCSAGACVGAPVEDFRSCDDDPNDCTEDYCIAGVCTPELYEDCTGCGDTGSGLCASGVCGGVGAAGSYDFEAGAMPSEFTTGGTSLWAIATDEVHTGSFSTRSPAIGASQDSSFTVEVEMAEAGSVSFWYTVSSESCCDGLDFTVDGAEVDDWRGTIGWTEFTHPLEAGTHTLTWRYFKDASLSTGSDAAWVDDITLNGTNACPSDVCGDGVSDGEGCISCPVLPVGTACDGDELCQAYSCSEDGRCEGTPVADGVSCDSDPNDCVTELCVLGECLLEANPDCSDCAGGADLCMGGVCGGVGLDLEFDFEDGFPDDFVGSGDAVWEIDSTVAFSGTSSASNGDIGNSQESILELTVELLEPGEVSFWHRENSESTFDSLEFRIDGGLQESWAGINEWAAATFALDAGVHTLGWRYEKDGSVSSGEDTVWIDDIRVVGGAVCEGSSDECAPELFDGATCQVCVVADGTACTGGTCSVGICE